jgi:hypothetical protein
VSFTVPPAKKPEKLEDKPNRGPFTVAVLPDLIPVSKGLTLETMVEDGADGARKSKSPQSPCFVDL